MYDTKCVVVCVVFYFGLTGCTFCLTRVDVAMKMDRMVLTLLVHDVMQFHMSTDILQCCIQ